MNCFPSQTEIRWWTLKFCGRHLAWIFSALHNLFLSQAAARDANWYQVIPENDNSVPSPGVFPI